MSTPGMHKCSCQACGGHIEYPPEYEGMEFACPHCGQGTRVQLPQIQVNPAASASIPAPEIKTDLYATQQISDVERSKRLEGRPPVSQENIADPKTEPNSYVCENCGGAIVPEDKVCIECGHRRPLKSKWTANAIFRLVAGIVLLAELAVLGLQWTTKGKPFGLRQRTRHAVLVKVGLREELDPAKQAAVAGKNVAASAVAKDSDLKLKSHELKPDKDNGSLWIQGAVKNVSQYRYLAVKVRFNLKDEKGEIIRGAEVSAYQQAIEPGKEWAFKVLLLDPDASDYSPILPIEGYR